MTYNKKLDYCSFAPDRIFGITINFACYLHDRQYRNEVKSRLTRKQADKIFRDRIYNMFVRNNKKIRGWIVSRTYYIAVRLFAKKYWELN